MSLWNLLCGIARASTARRRRLDRSTRRGRRLVLEVLEDRLCPSGGYLLVGSNDPNSVMRYDETTGAFVDEFVPHNSGGLKQPMGLVFGPRDHNLYVVGGLWG